MVPLRARRVRLHRIDRQEAAGHRVEVECAQVSQAAHGVDWLPASSSANQSATHWKWRFYPSARIFQIE